jgi:hypothetical protein
MRSSVSIIVAAQDEGAGRTKVRLHVGRRRHPMGSRTRTLYRAALAQDLPRVRKEQPPAIEWAGLDTVARLDSSPRSYSIRTFSISCY